MAKTSGNGEAPKGETKAERDARTDQRDGYRRLETEVWVGEDDASRLNKGEG
jgi:hypothetical protein